MSDTKNATIPQFGFGTAGRRGDEGRVAILAALELGYRHIDTAQSYDTEASVGWAMREMGVNRDDVFITTKVADTNLDKADFRPSLERSLETIGVDQVDLTLIHWPSNNERVPLDHYMTELVRAQEDGLTRLIGVSNFTIELIDRSQDIIGTGRLSTNQVECHPYLQNCKLHDFCSSQSVSITAYLPLAKGRLADDPVLSEIGGRHGVEASQVALAFLMHQGIIVIPSSSRREHIAANLKSCEVELNADEIARIKELDRGARFIDPEKAPDWD